MSTLSINLPRSPESAGAARQLVNDHTISLDSQQRQDAALMVSELVNNAVLHGVGAFSLHIDVEAGAVRIEVADEATYRWRPRRSRALTAAGGCGSLSNSPMTGEFSRAAPGSGSGLARRPRRADATPPR
jgi:two-component sensor histidine kinase